MGSMSIWHWVIVLLVVLLLFGRGRLSDVMGDFAKGIKSFKKGLAEDETPPQAAAPREIAHTPREPAAPLSQEEARRS